VPLLRLKRSAQSGSKAMAAAYAVVYTESTVSGMAYIVAGAEFDLSNMVAGDVIDVRVRKVVILGGGWVNHDEFQYIGAQPAGHPSKHINPIPDVYGVSIEMRQTAGALISVDMEAFDAKRLGMP
ncbi:unnamed protein product, partial [marine sediment metagenome]